MPTQSSFDDIHERIELLLFQLNDHSLQQVNWKATRARQVHEDEYGNLIQPGEYYICQTGFNPQRFAVDALWSNLIQDQDAFSMLHTEYLKAKSIKSRTRQQAVEKIAYGR